MNIAQYLEKEEMTREEFAKALGVACSALSHWIAGRRTPRPSMAHKIVEITDGKVKLKDIYPEPEKIEA